MRNAQHAASPVIQLGTPVGVLCPACSWCSCRSPSSITSLCAVAEAAAGAVVGAVVGEGVGAAAGEGVDGLAKAGRIWVLAPAVSLCSLYLPAYPGICEHGHAWCMMCMVHGRMGLRMASRDETRLPTNNLL